MSKKSILAESHYTREDEKYNSFQRISKCTVKDNILKYERSHVKMSNSNRNNTQRTTGTQQTGNQFGVVPPQPAHQSPQQIENPINKHLSTIVCSVLAAAIIGAGGILYNNLLKINDNIVSINIEMAKINTEVANLKNDVDKMDDRLHIASNEETNTIRLIPTEELTCSVNQSIQSSTISTPICLSAPTWSSGDVIAKDVSGKLYTAGQLKNEKLLLPYKSNGQEVYFYGQFNENNQWDGECVINVYKDNALILLTEAMYNNGVIQSYKQVLTIDKNDKKSWIISDRVNRGDYNSGESWRYRYDKDQTSTKSFDIETVENNDIVFVDEFKQSLKTKLEGYYYGNTSDGMYNDATGTAYLVKYDESGFIRTLYSGNFKDGKFEDNTGNAWYITRNVDTDTEYMYYKGNFSNGSPTRKSKYDFKNNLTREDIDTYMKGKVFNCEIAWAETESMKSNK